MANKKILIDIKVTDAQASTGINKTTKAVDGLAKSTKNLGVRTSKNNANSGLNNTILQESGRLASDAAYGFQGMANNLGQLVSLFQISAKNSGGFVNSLKDLKTSFFGVGGILIGVQLLISFLPQIQKWFQKSAKAALGFSGAFDKLSEKVGNSAGNFEIYIKTLQSSTKSEKEKKDAIESLNKEFPDYISSLKKANVSLDDVSNKTSAATIANKDYRESIVELALAQAAQAKIQEIQAEKLEKIAVRRLELQKLALTEESLANTRAREQEKASSFDFVGLEGGQDLNREKTIKRLRSETKEHKQFLANKDKEIDVLIEFTDIQLKSTKTLTELKKAFVAGELDFDKEIVKSMARVSSSLAFNEEFKIKTQSDSQKKLARIRQEDFADRQQKRVDAIKNDEDRAKAQIAVDASIAESQASLNAYLKQIDKEKERKINQTRTDDITKANALLAKEMESRAEAQKSFEVSMAENEFNRFDRQRELSDIERDNTIKNLELKKNAAIVAGKSTIGIEEQITNATLLNADKKKQINEDEQQAKLDTANFVGQAIIAIAGEGSAVGKAVAVAMATMNTYEAVTAALGAKPYGPWNIAQAAATAAFGFLQVKNILSTPTPGGSSSGGGGAAGGGTVNAPDFNVVGTSETSQLAQAVGQTSQSQVVKAYVVGSEITSQQEFDRKITNTAGL